MKLLNVQIGCSRLKYTLNFIKKYLYVTNEMHHFIINILERHKVNI